MHTYTHICVCIAVRAKRAARLTATFCSLPFYFLPFLTLAHNMQAYRHKGAERWGVWGEGSRLHHAGLLYKCFIMGLAFQTFIRFDLVCMLRESLPSGFRFSFISFLLPLCFSAFSCMQCQFRMAQLFLNIAGYYDFIEVFFRNFFWNFLALKLQIKPSAHESVNCSLTLCLLIKSPWKSTINLTILLKRNVSLSNCLFIIIINEMNKFNQR